MRKIYKVVFITLCKRVLLENKKGGARLFVRKIFPQIRLRYPVNFIKLFLREPRPGLFFAKKAEQRLLSKNIRGDDSFYYKI